MMYLLINVIVLILSQCLHVSEHHTVYLFFFFLIKLFLMGLKFCDRFLVKLFSLKSTDFKN